MNWKVSPRNLAILATGGLVFVSLSPGGRAQDKAATAEAWASGEVEKAKKPAKGAALLLIEPKSLRPPVSVMVPEARATVFCAAYQGLIGARHYDREGFRTAFPGGWKEFYAGAVKAASEHLKSLEPKLVRNKNKVIEYALLQSDHVLTPTVVLAPAFREMFATTLGPQLLIAIPDRSTILVFPKLAGSLEKHRPALEDLFDDAVYPVSEEIFELTKDGIRVVGAFRTD